MSRGALSLLRNRNFVLLWCAYFVSAAADHLFEMAVLKTQNALADDVDMIPLNARMTFVFFVPFFLFGPMMGFLADRLSRKWLMVFADVARMWLMVGFAWLIQTFSPISPHWGPFLPLAMVGLFAAMFSPARSALLPSLISTEQLLPANAMIRGVGVLASIVSVVIGGWLADNYAPVVAFRIDALAFAASMVLILFIRPPAGAHAFSQSTHKRRVFEELVGGFRYAARHRRVVQLLIIGMIFWFSAAAIRSVVPAIVKTVYMQVSYQDITLFQARLAIGMVIGALTLATLGNSLRSEIAVTWALIGAGACASVLAVSAMVPMPIRLAYHGGGLGVIGLGVFGAALIASYNALLQRIVPNRYRGRVFGVLDLCTVGGLLVATGFLGIPEWPGLDRWSGWIVMGLAVLLVSTGLVTLYVRLTAEHRPPALGFFQNLNEVFCKFWYRLQRKGPCTVPRSGPVIVVAHHTCSADPLMITAACRHRVLSFLIAEEYSRIPIASWFVRLIHCVPVKRDAADAAGVKAALRRLRDGDALGIFIEGRIPPPGEQAEPKEGAAMLALKTGAAVIPVSLSGNKYQDGIIAGFFARHDTTVRFGPPVDLSGVGDGRAREHLHEATSRIVEAIRRLEADA